MEELKIKRKRSTILQGEVFFYLTNSLMGDPFRPLCTSMRRKGNCWDNAPTERFFRSLKSERLSDYIFTTRKAAQAQVIDYIGYYNGIRLHSTLGYQPPVIYEKELYRNAA